MENEEAWLDSFIFQQRHGRLNVRAISRIDLSSVIEHVEVEKLHEVLENVAFCNLKKTDLPALSDEMLVKTFRLSQLIIEYLLNRQNHLDMRLETLTEEADTMAEDIQALVQDNRVLADANDAMKRDQKSRKKQLQMYQQLLNARGHKGKGLPAENVAAHVCRTCGKAFSGRVYLKKHCARRQHVPFEEEFLGDDTKENNGSNMNHALVSSFKQIMKEELREELDASYSKAYALHTENMQRVRRDFEEAMQRRVEEQNVRYESTITGLQAKVDAVENIRKQDAEEARKRISQMEEENRRLLSQLEDLQRQERRFVEDIEEKQAQTGLPKSVVLVDSATQADLVKEVVEKIELVEPEVVESEESAKAEVKEVDVTQTSTNMVAHIPESATIALQTTDVAEEKRPVEVNVDDIVRDYLQALDQNLITAAVLRQMKEVAKEFYSDNATPSGIKPQPKLFCPVESGLVKSRFNHDGKVVKTRIQLVRQKLETLSSGVGITNEIIGRLRESGELQKLQTNLSASLESIVGRGTPKKDRAVKIQEVEAVMNLVASSKGLDLKPEESANGETAKAKTSTTFPVEKNIVKASTKDDIGSDSDESSVPSDTHSGTQEGHNERCRDSDIRSGSQQTSVGKDVEVKEESSLEQYPLESDVSELSSISHSGFIPRYEEDSSLANSFQRNVLSAEELENSRANIARNKLAVPENSVDNQSPDITETTDELTQPNLPRTDGARGTLSEDNNGASAAAASPGLLLNSSEGSSIEQKSQGDEESPLPPPPSTLPTVDGQGQAQQKAPSRTEPEALEASESTTSPSVSNEQEASTASPSSLGANSETEGMVIRRVSIAEFNDIKWDAKINFSCGTLNEEANSREGSLEESNLSVSSYEELAHE